MSDRHPNAYEIAGGIVQNGSPLNRGDAMTMAKELLQSRRDFQDGKIAGPIPLLLHCPECGERHVDKGTFAEKPHHTHACQHCGMTWRPAIVDTVGVQFLPGFKDES